jgi:hypothetical protein
MKKRLMTRNMMGEIEEELTVLVDERRNEKRMRQISRLRNTTQRKTTLEA